MNKLSTEKDLMKFAKKSFKWVKKNPDKLLSVVVSVVQLGNILMGGHPTKSKEYKEKRIKEISEEFKIPTEDVRKLLSQIEPVYTHERSE